jgi:hypothetical protein
MVKSVTRTSVSVRLNVPFHRQASQFTCGPACLMMAMKFFQPSLNLNRKLEFDIWREANLVESYGTSKEGLALAAARRGFDVCTLGRALRHSFVDAIHNKIPNIDYKMLELLYNDTKTKFRFMGLKNVSREVRLSNLKNALRNSHIPILLTSTSLFGEKEPLPHWVVLTGYGRDSWYLNNPLAKSPNTRLGRRTLGYNLGYKGIRCAVIVHGLKGQ